MLYLVQHAISQPEAEGLNEQFGTAPHAGGHDP